MAYIKEGYNMHFELLQLYRNYRNIDSVTAVINGDSDTCSNENVGEMIVFGHFDRVRFSDKESAATALSQLYSDIRDDSDLSKKTDMQPVILCSNEDNFNPKENEHQCVVVSFMQIGVPQNIKDIDKYYSYAKEKINYAIERIQIEHLIGNVEAYVYVPLSFMNVAVIFTADEFTDICVLLKNLIANKVVEFQYSILAMNDAIGVTSSSHGISLSLRFIWKTNEGHVEAVKALEDILSDNQSLTADQYKITHLLGNNDCLLTVVGEGYTVLNMLFGEQNESNKKINDFFRLVKNTRVSVRFDDVDIKIIEFVGQDKQSYKSNENRNKNIIQQNPKTADELIKKLNELEENLGLIGVQDLIYKVTEFEKFVRIIYEHAKNNIALPLYNSIIDPYNKFIMIALEWLKRTEAINSRLQILDSIGNTVGEMLSYYGNILHCNLGFFEERGFYNSIIGVATNIELAYNKYAGLICNSIMCSHEKEVQNIDVCCYVISDKSMSVCASDPFSDENAFNLPEKYIISINIPVSYLFRYEDVSNFIIHEAAHFLGCRQRNERAEVVYKVLARTISHVLYQYMRFCIGDTAPKDAKRMLEDFEKTSEFQKIYNKVTEDILGYIYNQISDDAKSVIEKNEYDKIYMSVLLDVLVQVLNSLLISDGFVESLAGIIAEYHSKYYMYFEDFYARNYERYEDIGDVLNDLSRMIIEEYNKVFIIDGIKLLFGRMITPVHYNDDGDSDDIDEMIVIVPDLTDLISMVCKAINEAYSDIMMISVMDMDFDKYKKFIKKWYNKLEDAYEYYDVLTWLRVNFVAGYMNVDIHKHIETESGSIMDYYENISIINEIVSYFDGLRSEFQKVQDRVQADCELSNLIQSIKSGDELSQFKAIYNMFMSLQ